MMPTIDDGQEVSKTNADHFEITHSPLPPYVPTVNSPTHPTRSTSLDSSASQGFRVSRVNESIRGTYTIDPGLVIPAALFAGDGENKETGKWNVKLETKKGNTALRR